MNRLVAALSIILVAGRDFFMHDCTILLLLHPGAAKFDVASFHQVILEKTGVEIDEDEVFLNLPHCDILTLLREGEEWKPNQSQVRLALCFSMSCIYSRMEKLRSLHLFIYLCTKLKGVGQQREA